MPYTFSFRKFILWIILVIIYSCIEAAVVVPWKADLIRSTNGRGKNEAVDGGSYNGALQRPSNCASQARYTPPNIEAQLLKILCSVSTCGKRVAYTHGHNPDPMVTPQVPTKDRNSAWMGDLPSTRFSMHPTTYGPPNHSGVSEWIGYFSTNHVETYGLVLGGDRCQPACYHPFKVFTFERRQ